MPPSSCDSVSPHGTGRLLLWALCAFQVHDLGCPVQRGHTAAALSPKLGQSVTLGPPEETSAICLCPGLSCGIYFCPPGPLLVLFSLHGSLPLPRKQDPPVVDQLGCPWSGPEEHMELPRASGLRKQELQRPRYCAPGHSPWPGSHACSLTSSLPSSQRVHAVPTLILPMGIEARSG